MTIIRRIAGPVIALVAAWFLIWPTSLGGPMTYVMVSGPSMEPLYESGDFIVARERSAYDVDDVVVFASPKGNVVHRIVDGDAADGFVTQGDNNPVMDPWRTTPDDILGEVVLAVPGMGSWVLAARTWLLTPPMPYAIAGFVFVLIVFGGKKPRRDEEQESSEGILAAEELQESDAGIPCQDRSPEQVSA